MIARFCVWYWAFSKRLLQKRFFLLLLCIFPVLCFAISRYSQSNSPLIQVALFQEGGDELGKETIKSLKKQHKIVHFYEAESLDQLYLDVKKTKAECGYIFTENYTQENLLQQRLWTQSVKVIESPGSMLTGSINELVFSTFFQFYTEELLLDYLSKPEVLKPGQDLAQIQKEASAQFKEYNQAGGIFTTDTDFNKSSQNAETLLLKQTERITNTFLSNLCRGILSILILLAALSGALQLIQDQKTSLLLPLPNALRPIIALVELLTPTSYMGISGIIGIVFLPAAQPIWKELLGLILYILSVILFTYILLRCVRTETLFRTLLPLLSLGALLLPPVFIDFSVYAKVLTIPKYFFVNTYYLEMVTGRKEEWMRFGSLLLLLIIFWFLLNRKNFLYRKKNA